MSIKTKKRTRLTPAKMEKVAIELMTYLQKHELFSYVYIYVNGKCYSDSNFNGLGTCQMTTYGKYYVIPNMPVKEIMEYCNPETISVKFDSALYYEINQGDGWVNDDLNKMFKKYGMYFEQGYPSDFSLYYND